VPEVGSEKGAIGMKAIVVYYTQTGNTKKIAEDIVDGLGEAGTEAVLASIREVDPRKDLAAYDLIGLGSPVMILKEPSNVTAFISAMRQVDGKHGFAFCTHGTLPAQFIGSVVSQLRQRGLTVIGWADWFGSAVYPLLPKPYFTDGHPDEQDLEEARAFGREMAERSRRVAAGEAHLIPELPTGSKYDELYDPVDPPWELLRDFEKIVSRTQFRINPDKCRHPKCSHCADHCPVGAIDFAVSPPRFTRRCFECGLCEQTCPQGAIEVDWQSLQEAHDLMAKQWLGKAVDVFEAQGRFRRLVPLEQIGWETPQWRRERPRFRLVR